MTFLTLSSILCCWGGGYPFLLSTAIATLGQCQHSNTTTTHDRHGRWTALTTHIHSPPSPPLRSDAGTCGATSAESQGEGRQSLHRLRPSAVHPLPALPSLSPSTPSLPRSVVVCVCSGDAVVVSSKGLFLRRRMRAKRSWRRTRKAMETRRWEEPTRGGEDHPTTPPQPTSTISCTHRLRISRERPLIRGVERREEEELPWLVSRSCSRMSRRGFAPISERR